MVGLTIAGLVAKSFSGRVTTSRVFGTHSLSVGLILMDGVFFSVAHSAKFHCSGSSIDVHTPLSSLDPFNLINMGLCAEVYGDSPGGFKYPAITTPTVKVEGSQGEIDVFRPISNAGHQK